MFERQDFIGETLVHRCYSHLVDPFNKFKNIQMFAVIPAPSNEKVSYFD